MELSEYIKKEGIKKGWFAKKVGISRRTLSSVLGGYKVNALMAVAIEAHTNGEVEAKSLCKNLDDIRFLKEE
jgi:DNA-binding transcriptional regulator YdaS (Cro superfamily)